LSPTRSSKALKTDSKAGFQTYARLINGLDRPIDDTERDSHDQGAARLPGRNYTAYSFGVPTESRSRSSTDAATGDERRFTARVYLTILGGLVLFLTSAQTH
jgi:hypothetical protein